MLSVINVAWVIRTRIPGIREEIPVALPKGVMIMTSGAILNLIMGDMLEFVCTVIKRFARFTFTILPSVVL